MMHINRRSFVKFSLTAFGGIMLTGCGGAGSYGSSDIPNGYRFYKVKTRGETISGRNDPFQIDYFGGSMHLSSDGVITFDAIDKDKQKGIFQLGLDIARFTPRIDWERLALLVGDKLADERVVSGYRSFDVDENANIAAILEADIRYSENHYGAGLYSEIDQMGFQPLLIAGQSFNGGLSMSSGIFGDVSYSNRNILASAHYVATDFSSKSDSLIHIPNHTLDDASILISSGDIVAGTNHTASSFGLIDHNLSGDYSSNVFVVNSSRERTSEQETQGSINIKGNVNSPKNLMTRATMTGAVIDEGMSYGTRISDAGDIWSTQDVGDVSTLLQNEKVVMKTGDHTTAGNILSISPGSVGADGTYFFTAITERNNVAGVTLFATNGSDTVTILSSGDVLSDNGVPVEGISFGTTTKHIDDENRLVFLCSFADETTSLMLGIPA
ncbi:MAG: hypothetical protein C0602_06220 [Denitrovibrio sp.]|nr:MAG: hypothetical protein C0602_06220 [Denitrovibrio sp.]